MNYQERINHDPQVLAGKPTIKGTRVPVDLILKKLAQNISLDEVLQDFPRLEREDIQAAILYAHELVEDQVSV